jgi:hypothetical protein
MHQFVNLNYFLIDMKRILIHASKANTNGTALLQYLHGFNEIEANNFMKLYSHIVQPASN